VSLANAIDPIGSFSRVSIFASVSTTLTNPRLCSVELRTAEPIALARLLKGYPQTIFYIVCEVSNDARINKFSFPSILFRPSTNSTGRDIHLFPDDSWRKISNFFCDHFRLVTIMSASCDRLENGSIRLKKRAGRRIIGAQRLGGGIQNPFFN